MRLLCLTLFTTAALLLPGPLHAQLIIDFFTDNTAPFQLPGNSSPIITSLPLVNRTLSGSISGSDATLTTQINNGWTTTGTAGTGSSYAANILDEAYAALNLSTTPYLQLQIANISGTLNLNIQLLTEDLHSLTYSGNLDSSLSGQSFTLDVRDMAGYTDGDLNNVRIFSLELSGSNADSSVDISQFQFSTTNSLAAAPEPSSWAFAAIATVSLFVLYRRRPQE